MSKRTVYTDITPLPANVTREVVLDFLHNHLEMIDLNPLIKERHPIPPPADAPPEERQCSWYSLTDEITYLPGGVAAGDVTYTAAMFDLPNGLQTHCRAPLGVVIRSRWTLNGTLPGEPLEPVELGINAPQSGLYIREDVDLRCNVLMTSFVKKTTRRAHSKLVEHLAAKAAVTTGRAGVPGTPTSPRPRGGSWSSSDGSVRGFAQIHHSQGFGSGKPSQRSSFVPGHSTNPPAAGGLGLSNANGSGFNFGFDRNSFDSSSSTGSGGRGKVDSRRSMFPPSVPSPWKQQGLPAPAGSHHSLPASRVLPWQDGPPTPPGSHRSPSPPGPAPQAWQNGQPARPSPQNSLSPLGITPWQHGQPTPPGSQSSSPQPSLKLLPPPEPAPAPALPIQQRFSMYAAFSAKTPQRQQPQPQVPSPQFSLEQLQKDHPYSIPGEFLERPRTMIAAMPPPKAPAYAPPPPPVSIPPSPAYAPPPPPVFTPLSPISSPRSVYSASSPVLSDDGLIGGLYPDPLRLHKWNDGKNTGGITDFPSEDGNNYKIDTNVAKSYQSPRNAATPLSPQVDYSLIYPEMNPYADGMDDDDYVDVMVETPVDAVVVPLSVSHLGGASQTYIAELPGSEKPKAVPERYRHPDVLKPGGACGVSATANTTFNSGMRWSEYARVSEVRSQ